MLGTAGSILGTYLGNYVYDNWDQYVDDVDEIVDQLDTHLANALDAFGETTGTLAERLKAAADVLKSVSSLFSGDDENDGDGEQPTQSDGEQGGPGDGESGTSGDREQGPKDRPSSPNFGDPRSIPGLPLENFYDPPISPLVLDLDGDGIALVSLADSKAWYDLDKDGFAQHTGWAAPEDALLAIDRNSNGRIDNIGEVFGNGTTDGFAELRELDSNGDGTIDSNDKQFGKLLLWRDLNGNGWSESSELQSLADGRVQSIDLTARGSDTTNAGHRISHIGSFTKTDGSTGTIVDAWFENDRHISTYLPSNGFIVHEDVTALPELRGLWHRSLTIDRDDARRGTTYPREKFDERQRHPVTKRLSHPRRDDCP